jgi:hypothetical protein
MFSVSKKGRVFRYLDDQIVRRKEETPETSGVDYQDATLFGTVARESEEVKKAGLSRKPR